MKKRLKKLTLITRRDSKINRLHMTMNDASVNLTPQNDSQQSLTRSRLTKFPRQRIRIKLRSANLLKRFLKQMKTTKIRLKAMKN